MTQMKRIAFIATILAGSFAFADDSAPTGSEFQHQANAGTWEVTPALTYGDMYMADDPANTGSPLNQNPNTSTDDHFFMLSATGEYGIIPMLSVGVKLMYEMDSISYSPSNGIDPTGGTSMKASGLTDPEIFVNGRNELSFGSLRWGAHFRFTLGKHVIDSSGTSEDENSGGMTFTPFVGYERQLGSTGVIGARLKYDIIQTDRNFTDNSTAVASLPGMVSYTVKGGNNAVLSVFYETNLDPVILGFDTGLFWHQGSTINFSQPVAGVSSLDAHDGQMAPFLDVYGNWKLAPNIELLPKFGMNVVNSNQGYLPGTVAQNKVVTTSGTVGARFSF